MNYNSFIGERVRFYRTSHGLSMETMAEKFSTPISGQMLARYETGKARWPADLVIEIASYLHVDIRLLTGQQDIKPEGDDEKEWEAEKYKHLLLSMSDKARKVIYYLIDGVKNL